MRIWKALATAFLLTACSVPTPAPGPAPAPPAPGPVVVQPSPTKPPLPPPGPRQLEIYSRTNGWVMKATAESGTGRDELNSPLGVWWLGPDRAIVRWWWNSETEFHLVDLAAGTMTRLEGYVDIRADSPDGRHIVNHLPAQSEAWLMDVTAGNRVWQLPGPGARETWLSPTLLHVVYGQNLQYSLLYDLATGKETPLPEGGYPVVFLASRDVCYARQVEQVWCVPAAGGKAKLITPEKIHPDALNAGALMRWDPGRRYVAALYPKAAGLTWRLTATAYAMDPIVYAWGNELMVYDSLTGKASYYPLGGEYIRNGLVWSPDGTHLAIALGRMERKGTKVTPRGSTEFRVLNVAAGKFTKVAEVGEQNYVLRLVTNAGEVVYQAAYDQQPLLAAPGAKPKPWAPGLTLLPDPLTGMPPGAMAFTDAEWLEVRTAEGSAYRWRWEGGAGPGVSAAIGPDAQWAAVQVNKPGTLVFLKR